MSKTANGVEVKLGETQVWFFNGRTKKIQSIIPASATEDYFVTEGYKKLVPISDCYSTEQTAAFARAKKILESIEATDKKIASLQEELKELSKIIGEMNE